MFGLPKGIDLLVILGVMLLVFGNRLPGLGRSLGKGIVEFKKGLSGIGDEVADVDHQIQSSGQKTQQLDSKPQSQVQSPASTRQQKLEA